MTLKDCWDCCECGGECEGECTWVFRCDNPEEPECTCSWIKISDTWVIDENSCYECDSTCDETAKPDDSTGNNGDTYPGACVGGGNALLMALDDPCDCTGTCEWIWTPDDCDQDTFVGCDPGECEITDHGDCCTCVPSQFESPLDADFCCGSFNGSITMTSTGNCSWCGSFDLGDCGTITLCVTANPWAGTISGGCLPTKSVTILDTGCDFATYDIEYTEAELSNCTGCGGAPFIGTGSISGQGSGDTTGELEALIDTTNRATGSLDSTTSSPSEWASAPGTGVWTQNSNCLACNGCSCTFDDMENGNQPGTADPPDPDVHGIFTGTCDGTPSDPYDPDPDDDPYDPYNPPGGPCYWVLEDDCGESNDSGCQCANKICEWEWSETGVEPSSSLAWTQISDCGCDNCECAEPPPLSPIPGVDDGLTAVTHCTGEGTTGSLSCDCDEPTEHTNDCGGGTCEYLCVGHDGSASSDCTIFGNLNVEYTLDSDTCEPGCGCPDPPSCGGGAMCANFATLDCIDSNATGYEEGETATTPCYGGPCDTSNAACCAEGECGYIWDEYTASWELDSDTCSFCVSEEDCSVCREDVECGCQEPTYTPSTDQESAQGSCMPIAGTGESSEPIPFRASLSNRTFGLSSKIPQIRNSREEIRNSSALKVTRKGVSKVYLNVKAIKRKRRAMARKVASRRQRMR